MDNFLSHIRQKSKLKKPVGLSLYGGIFSPLFHESLDLTNNERKCCRIPVVRSAFVQEQLEAPVLICLRLYRLNLHNRPHDMIKIQNSGTDGLLMYNAMIAHLGNLGKSGSTLQCAINPEW